MNIEQMRDSVVKSLEDMKAGDIVVCDVRGKTSIADFFVIATGTSSRHTKALATSVTSFAKDAGYRIFGTEGLEASEWVLVDLGDVIVHLMQDSTRKLYDLEGLWQPASAE